MHKWKGIQIVEFNPPTSTITWSKRIYLDRQKSTRPDSSKYQKSSTFMNFLKQCSNIWGCYQLHLKAHLVSFKIVKFVQNTQQMKIRAEMVTKNHFIHIPSKLRSKLKSIFVRILSLNFKELARTIWESFDVIPPWSMVLLSEKHRVVIPPWSMVLLSEKHWVKA